MNVYFDTEFTNLGKDADLISIGMITENSDVFYAEITDYDRNKCSEFVKSTVLPNLYFGTRNRVDNLHAYRLYDMVPGICSGTKVEVRDKITDWLSKYNNIQLVSDCCHFDMVQFIDLYGDASNLPKGVAPVCHDINGDIAKNYNISDIEAFDKSREEIYKELESTKLPSNIPLEMYSKAFFNLGAVAKHNALYDAIIIARISDYLGIRSN